MKSRLNLIKYINFLNNQFYSKKQKLIVKSFNMLRDCYELMTWEIFYLKKKENRREF